MKRYTLPPQADDTRLARVHDKLTELTKCGQSLSMEADSHVVTFSVTKYGHPPLCTVAVARAAFEGQTYDLQGCPVGRHLVSRLQGSLERSHLYALLRRRITQIRS